MQTCVLALFVFFSPPLVVRWEEKSWRIRFSVPLWVDKLNKASITAHVHQSLPALLSTENFICGLARHCCTGDPRKHDKAFHVRSYICVCMQVYALVFLCVMFWDQIQYVHQNIDGEIWIQPFLPVHVWSWNARTSSIVTLVTHHKDICVFFGRRVTFSHHNKLVNGRRLTLTSLLTSTPKIAMRHN